jgi:hypothetical protein
MGGVASLGLAWGRVIGEAWYTSIVTLHVRGGMGGMAG